MTPAAFPAPAEPGADPLVALAALRVPRYTSYPTALSFSPAVDEAAYRGWLAATSPATPLSLYLHVPFCRTLCLYCGCHTRAEQRQTVIAAYAEALAAEIGLVAAALPGRMKVVHIHWGGGTPGDLGAAGMARVGSALGDAFDIAADAEHAAELDPRRIDAARAECLAALGINRVSLGVQTFDPRVQRAIGRIQPFAVVAAAVEALCGAGIPAINLDLMYGLPHQDVRDVADTARKAATLAPRRLSVFGYAHVPWAKKVQRGIDAGALPGPAERLAQMRAMRGALVGAGYVPVGFDHFALPGDAMAAQAEAGALTRNFQGYTTDRAAGALIGFGASAIGQLGPGYAQNEPGIEAWQAAVEVGRLPVTRGVALDAEDRWRAALIEAVLCRGGVPLAAIPAGERDGIAARLAAFARDGLVEIDAGEARLTELGWPFARLVAALFDARLTGDTLRHSLAI